MREEVARMVTPEAVQKRARTQRENTTIRHSLVAAGKAYQYRAQKEILPLARKFAKENDGLGMTAFFLEMLCGSGEDRRAMLATYAKMLPIEVEGAVDSGLVINILSLAGPVAPITIPKEPVRAAVPVPLPAPAPEEAL